MQDVLVYTVCTWCILQKKLWDKNQVRGITRGPQFRFAPGPKRGLIQPWLHSTLQIHKLSILNQHGLAAKTEEMTSQLMLPVYENELRVNSYGNKTSILTNDATFHTKFLDFLKEVKHLPMWWDNSTCFQRKSTVFSEINSPFFEFKEIFLQCSKEATVFSVHKETHQCYIKAICSNNVVGDPGDGTKWNDFISFHWVQEEDGGWRRWDRERQLQLTVTWYL